MEEEPKRPEGPGAVESTTDAKAPVPPPTGEGAASASMEFDSTTLPKGTDWQDVLDARLVRRLMSRSVRPGLVNLAQASAIIARNRGMAAAMPLADRLNRAWFELGDGKGEPSPIVYLQPRPFAPDMGNPPPASAPTGGRSGSENTKGESAHPVQRVSKVKPQKFPSPSGKGPGEGDQNMVVQRKPMEGASPSLMALGTGVGSDGSIAIPMRDSTVPLVTPIRTPYAPQFVSAPEYREGLVHRTVRQDRPVNVDAVESTNDAPLPVPSATGNAVELRTEPMLFTPSPHGRSAAKAAGGGTESEASVVAPTGHQTNKTLPQPLPLLRIQPRASASSPPIVRESLVTETRRGTFPVHGSLPLAGETPRARQRMADQPAGSRQSKSISARAAAVESGRPTPPVHRESIAENTKPAEALRQPAPNIDIDGIVDKVERRFARRLAIESERRGRFQWR